MNKKQLTKYKKLLKEEKKKVLLQLSFDEVQMHDLEKKESGDIVDLAFSMYEKDRAIRMSEAQKRLLEALDNALKRIENGVYGNCIHCGEGVDLVRLDAVPWALSCVDPKNCKNAYKKKSIKK